MAFSFGQSAPAFGAGTATGFGAQAAPFGAASTPAFGAASAPAFGASSAAFSFASSTPAFGAATPAFGAASAPAFGSTPSLFGATATPAFGAAANAPFGAASTPSLFGATSTPSLFGAASTPAFGASSTPSLFGATSAGAFNFASTSSLFGAAASAPAAQNTGFGLTTQMAPPSYSAPPSQDPAMKELMEIAAAYTPSSPSFRFSTLLLNVVDNPQQRGRPAGVDELRWRQAMKEAGGPDNPNKLWPVVATGFKDLAARASAQGSALAENQARLDALRALGHQLARKQEDDLRERAVVLQRQHVQLAHRLLRVCRQVDGLESRLGTVLGYRRDGPKERELGERLRGLEAEVAPMSSRSLHRQLESLSAAARLSGGAAAAAGNGEVLSEASTQRLFAVLKDHTAALQRLQEVVKEDQADLEVMRREVEGGDVTMMMVAAT